MAAEEMSKPPRGEWMLQMAEDGQFSSFRYVPKAIRMCARPQDHA